MSICDDIRFRELEGRLFLFQPEDIGVPVARPIYLSGELKACLDGPWSDDAEEERFGALRAELERFTSGGLISIAKEPYRARTAFLAQLDSPRDEVWEIRSRSPRPGIRVFGRFAATDVFVALGWAWRKNLRGPGEREWRDEIIRCKASWKTLFPTYEPYCGSNFNDYISENFLLV